MSELTVTEAAIIDLQRGKEAMARRSKQLGDPAVPSIPADAKGFPWRADYVDALSRPVRIEITFEDPLKTREQIEVLMACLTEALVVTQDHQRGINRQRMDLRNIVKTGAETLVMLNGKMPTGRKRLKTAE